MLLYQIIIHSLTNHFENINDVNHPSNIHTCIIEKLKKTKTKNPKLYTPDFKN